MASNPTALGPDEIAEVLRRHGTPTVGEFLRGGGTIHPSGADAAAHLLGVAPAAQLLHEFDEACREWEARVAAAPELQRFPHAYRIEDETARFLYLVTRLLRPAHVLETGVANGRSSFFLLAAMARNGTGELHSLDIRADAAGYLSDEERRRWHFTVIEPTVDSLTAAVEATPTFEVFVHDSAHRYDWQWAEYALALRRLPDGGVLASDDVDGSHAFWRFCEEHGLRPHYVFDGRKFSAAAVVGQPS